MQIYKVGGVVCDCFFGCLVIDIDWVVVGVSSDEMLVCGYCLVGVDFLVFFYLQSGEEYVLVCIEWKSGCGYGGFIFYVSFEVILEEDLICCDLIINVMVEDEQGCVIDFYGGQVDFEVCLLCYVFLVFVEDFLWVLCVVCFVVCYVGLGFWIVVEIFVLMC